MTLRNGEQLLLALVIPLLALIGGTLVSVVDLPEPRIDAVRAGGAGAGGDVVGIHLAGDHHRIRPPVRGAQAAGRGRGRPRPADRREMRGDAGRDRRPVRDPRRRWRCCWAGAREGSPLWVLVITLLGTAAFIGLALLLGGTLRAEAVLAVANLLWLVFVLVGGVIVPLDQSPAAAAHDR